MKIISEGYTYEYLIHGIMLVIAGILLGGLVHPAFILMIIVGIFMSASKTGIQIDSQGRKARKYISWVLFKTGVWQNLDHVVSIELHYNTQQSKVTRPIYLAKGDTTAKTFDLIFVDDTGEKKMINGFTKAGLAFKTLEALQGVGNYQIVNNVESMLKNQKQSRRRR